jgi:APA family basic amino acid/polyamine antiporter
VARHAGSAGPELKRELGVWSAAAIVVGTVIGSGIFLVPQAMISRVGSPGTVFLVWVFGGVLSLFGALTYAELSTAMPEAGGEYVYLREAYGPVWGFLYAWTQLLVAKSGSIAALATGFFLYMGNFFPQLDHVLYTLRLPIGPHGGPLEIRGGQLGAMAIILALAAVNYAGVKFGGRVQVAVTAAKVALIAAIVALGLGGGEASLANLGSSIQVPGGAAGFFAALVGALWAYDGWNNVSMVSSEIRDPQRSLPRALVAGTAGVIGIYLLANLAYFSVLPATQVASSSRVAADMMRRVLGNPGAAAVSVAALISIFAALNGSILSGARVTYVMFASWLLYGLTAAGVVVLRRKRPEMLRPYQVPGYPWVPVLFVLGALAVVAFTLRASPRESLMGMGVILLGLPFYFHWRRRFSW